MPSFFPFLVQIVSRLTALEALCISVFFCGFPHMCAIKLYNMTHRPRKKCALFNFKTTGDGCILNTRTQQHYVTERNIKYFCQSSHLFHNHWEPKKCHWMKKCIHFLVLVHARYTVHHHNVYEVFDTQHFSIWFRWYKRPLSNVRGLHLYFKS